MAILHSKIWRVTAVQRIQLLLNGRPKRSQKALKSPRFLSVLHRPSYSFFQSTVLPHARLSLPISPPSASLPSASSPARRYPLLPRSMGGQGDNVAGGSSPSDTNNWKIKMLYDGECPLCMREVNMLKERDKRYRAIEFVDISATSYSPKDNNDIEFETAMGRIHAVRRDGEVLTNVAAFRALYEEIGLGWVYSLTKHQPWASIAEAVYSFWAKFRLPVTGRPTLTGSCRSATKERRKQKCVIQLLKDATPNNL